MHSRDARRTAISRRAFLRAGGALGLGAIGQAFAARSARAAAIGCADDFGPLEAADANGLMLPPGFTSRVVATTGQVVPGTSYTWHAAPDGGATYPHAGGGWVYVSNSELRFGNGGVGALRFDVAGQVVDAYSILGGTTRNCAGGTTPWGTWLSCEEFSSGEVYECDPFTPGSQGVARPALGWFSHEAAVVDPATGRLYLTEDQPSGLLYRFTPTVAGDLSAGTLEAAEILDPQSQGAIAPGQVRPLAWHPIASPNPGSGDPATRDQAPSATPFAGGEGAWHEGGIVWFTTKIDNRVWRVDLAAGTIEILYDLATSSDPELSGVDNVVVSPCGDVIVAEDGGNLELVALTASGGVTPIVRLVGVGGTELTGPAFSPDGQRLYFSSQRNPGVTFEVSAPDADAASGPGLGGPWSALAVGAIGAAAWRARRGAGREG